MSLNHTRVRYLTEVILKKLKFSPVVIIQGARQTGKSFLVRQLLKPLKKKIKYITLDQASQRKFALENPDTFLKQRDSDEILIIDEAQKVPELFDAVKLAVDENRKPGMFVLLGSSEFSKLNLVRESLTGRSTRLRLFPLTLSETRHLNLSDAKDYLTSSSRLKRGELVRYLANGGMPGIFGIKDEQARSAAFNDWMSLTCDRDAVSFPKIKIDSELLRDILAQVSQLEDPSLLAITGALRVDQRKIKRHIEVLKTLYVLNEVNPISGSTGGPMYYFFDVGLLNQYDPTFSKKLKTWVLQELLAQTNYRGEFKRNIQFYRSQKGSFIDFIVLEGTKITNGFKIFDTEKTTSKDFELIRSFRKKMKFVIQDPKCIVALTGTSEQLKFNDVIAFPWESIG